MKKIAILAVAAIFILVGGLNIATAHKMKPTTHTIFMSVIEIKGSTTSDKLAPPDVNSKDLSKGYGYKAPGEADKSNPQKWEVASYMFAPAFMTIHKGDAVNLTVFVVNGDKHEVWITAPDGTKVVANTIWNRGREYSVSFVADQAGKYELVCSDHAPSMITTFFVLP